MSRSRPFDVFDEQYSRSRILCPWRHPDADEDQCGLPGSQSCFCDLARATQQRSGPGGGQHSQRHFQSRVADLRAAAQAFPARTVSFEANFARACPKRYLCWSNCKLARIGLSLLKQTLLVLVPNAIFAGVIAWVLGSLWDKHLGHTTLALKIGAVFVPGGIASLIYWLIAVWAKVPAAHDMFHLFRRRLGKK